MITFSEFIQKQRRRKHWLCRSLLCSSSVVVSAAMLSGLDTEQHMSVVAQNAVSDESHPEVQTVVGIPVQTESPTMSVGYEAVLTGIENMERYAFEVRNLSIEDPNEKVIAGVGGLSRAAIRRSAIEEGTKIAGDLTYYAQEFVHENQIDSEDYENLLRIVEAEATGGDIASKMLVASVVMNRVADEHFPDSISEVIWQPEQFQPTMDGRIYSVSITDDTIEAVENVLLGEDYSRGALFFCSRETSDHENLEWFDQSFVKVFEYGGHEYFTFQDDAPEKNI